MWSGFLGFLLLSVAVILILLVLVQRGKGGGLAGLGGMGGQSAFGTKAGDMFTRVTIGVAAFWIVLCMIAVKLLGVSTDRFDANLGTDGQPGQGLSAPASTEGPPEGAPGQPAAESPAPAGGQEE